MQSSDAIDVALTASLHAHSGRHGMDAVTQWIEQRRAAMPSRIEAIPFSRLRDWSFEAESGNLRHRSGRFFTVCGVEVSTNFGSVERWQQPIIDQPEIGILGFLAQEIDGVMHFLAQTKIEPGNQGLLQISPTLQATRSNFTRAHGGRQPDYLEYFLDADPDHILVDQFQSEQGARFFRKRNRNIVIVLPPQQQVPEGENHRWLTLAQLHRLLGQPNLINMDSRTVLSCLPLMADAQAQQPFAQALAVSLATLDQGARHGVRNLRNWITQAKTRYELLSRLIPLNKVAGWQCSDDEIRREDGRFFRVMAVDVDIGGREVASWQQPLIESAKGGVNGLLCREIGGVLHFLIQARVEPGTFDIIELAPTVQVTPLNYGDDPARLPPFARAVLEAPAERVRYDCEQSEEGGRFYLDCNRYRIVEAGDLDPADLPVNYTWMTLGQIKHLMQHNNVFNIEARSLVACLATLM